MTEDGSSNPSEASSFGAAPSALGYMYQCEVALLEFFRRSDSALALSMELLDDIAFEGGGTERLQSKYQVTPGSLTDASPDLWKTLRIWSEGAAAGTEAALVLITTAIAPDGSIAALLRAGDGRDPARAEQRLALQARTMQNKELEKASQAFLALDDEVRLAMVERIAIADSAPGFADLDSEFARVLRHAAPAERREALVIRLREWWLLRAEEHLVEVAKGSHERVSGEEIEARLADLRDQLAADNLPIDVENLLKPTDEEVGEDQRVFVMQLRLIALANDRIRLAVHDHNRAFAQRSRWVREDLVIPGELEGYDGRLREEWERVFLPETDESAELEEEDAREHGRQAFLACDGAVIEPVRPKVSAPFIGRGSFHMLANELRIGWHPDWVARVQALLEGVGK